MIKPNINSKSIFFFSLFIYFATYSVVGLIPINSGAGWDGSIYLNYIIKISQGVAVEKDPYRLIRLSGFFPAIIYSNFTQILSNLILFQLVFNVLILSVGVAVFFQTILILTNDKKKGLLGAGLIFFTWPYLIMPVYYPYLSDHLALLLVILSLFFWVKNNLLPQIFILIYSFFVMPALFVVPMMLCIVNKKLEINNFKKKYNSYLKIIAALIWLIGILGIFYLLIKLSSVDYLDIKNHPLGVNAGVPELKFYAITSVATVLFYYLWLVVNFIKKYASSNIINLNHSVVVLIAISFSSLILYNVVDWSDGFLGPPIFEYMMLQALAAPLKPLIAHFLYFGPIIIISYYPIFSAREQVGKIFPLFFILIIYFPILLFGSESRQWLSILPIAVLYAILNVADKKILLFCLISSLIMCFPMFFMKNEIQLAVSHGAHDFLSNHWQFYFGRQGPWISHQNYKNGLIFFAIFITFLIVVKIREKLRINKL